MRNLLFCATILSLFGTCWGAGFSQNAIDVSGSSVSVSESALPSNAAQEAGGNLDSIKSNTDNLDATLSSRATAANQTTANASLSSIDTKLTSPLTVVSSNGSSFSRITSNGTTTIKSGATLLFAICVNTMTDGATLTVYNNTAASGSVFGVMTQEQTGSVLSGLAMWTPTCTQYGGVALSTGLTVVAAGGPADWTVIYK